MDTGISLKLPSFFARNDTGWHGRNIVTIGAKNFLVHHAIALGLHK